MAVFDTPGDRLSQLQTLARQRSRLRCYDKTYQIVAVTPHPQPLHLLRVGLRPRRTMPDSVGRAIHAQCLRWIEAGDSSLSQLVHDAPSSPWSLGCWQQEGNWYLSIGLLQAELLSPLLWGMAADLGGTLTLAKVPCDLGSIVELVAANSYDGLLQQKPRSSLTLELRSPTSFKQQKDIQPFPLVDSVFNSLLRRWNLFAPDAQKLPEQIEWGGVVAAYDLKTYAPKMRAAEIGALGWIRYRFRDRDCQQQATALAGFAEYAGIGRKTAMGMGQAVTSF